MRRTFKNVLKFEKMKTVHDLKIYVARVLARCNNLKIFGWLKRSDDLKYVAGSEIIVMWINLIDVKN